jgi:sugar diacid utilization regulator
MRDSDKDVHKDEGQYYGYEDIIDEIVSMAASINPEVARAASTVDSKMAFANAAKSKPQHLISKYQAVQLLSILKKMSKSKSGEFIQKAIQYASSQSDLSSVFVKVW